jgi:hypothetical protein
MKTACRFYHTVLSVSASGGQTFPEALLQDSFFLLVNGVVLHPFSTMIVWGYQNHTSFSGDQTRFTRFFGRSPATCSNQECRSACRIDTVQRYCTIYCCIPLWREGLASVTVHGPSTGALRNLRNFWECATRTMKRKSGWLFRCGEFLLTTTRQIPRPACPRELFQSSWLRLNQDL